MLRRSLLRTAAATLLLPSAALARRHNNAGVLMASGLTPDCTVVDAPGAPATDGSAAGLLHTVYGAFGFGDIVEPNFRGGIPQFYEVMLNGVPANPYGFNSQRAFVGFGGNYFGSVLGDELISCWGDNGWKGDNGMNGPGCFAGEGGQQVPAGIPTPPALPAFVWAGPYTPSPDGTTITGGTGTVTTADGAWTFGNPSMGGWEINLNGVPVFGPVGPMGSILLATTMEVNSNGCLFAQDPVFSAWTVWNCHQQNPATGPTAGPVPTRVRFMNLGGIPNGGAIIPAASSSGTFLTKVTVTMSDGSPFSGTVTLSGGGASVMTVAGGYHIVSSVSPFASGPGTSYFTNVAAVQNGSQLLNMFHCFTD